MSDVVINDYAQLGDKDEWSELASFPASTTCVVYTSCFVHISSDLNDINLTTPITVIPRPLSVVYTQQNRQTGPVTPAGTDLQTV